MFTFNYVSMEKPRYIRLKLVPQNIPAILRYCSKCNKNTHFINLEKFRINANRSRLDVWLIYQCMSCKTTWNMAIYERIHPLDISKELYQRLLENDKELAMIYGWDASLHSRNKNNLCYDTVTYQTITMESGNPILEAPMEQGIWDSNDCFHPEMVIEIVCDYKTNIRIDKLLSRYLGISRKMIFTMYERGLIICDNDKSKNFLKSKLQGNPVFYIKTKE